MGEFNALQLVQWFICLILSFKFNLIFIIYITLLFFFSSFMFDLVINDSILFACVNVEDLL